MCFHKDDGGEQAAVKAAKMFDNIVADLSTVAPVPVAELLCAPHEVATDSRVNIWGRHNVFQTHSWGLPGIGSLVFSLSLHRDLLCWSKGLWFSCCGGTQHVSDSRRAQKNKLQQASQRHPQAVKPWKLICNQTTFTSENENYQFLLKLFTTRSSRKKKGTHPSRASTRVAPFHAVRAHEKPGSKGQVTTAVPGGELGRYLCSSGWAKAELGSAGGSLGELLAFSMLVRGFGDLEAWVFGEV